MTEIQVLKIITSQAKCTQIGEIKVKVKVIEFILLDLKCFQIWKILYQVNFGQKVTE